MPVPYKKKRNRISGRNVLAYMGSADADASAPLIWLEKAPTTHDYDFLIGTIWIDESTYVAGSKDPEVWMLVRKTGGSALWIRFYGGAAVAETLTGDTGGAVGPDATDTINVLGTADEIVTTGNPATNTITWSLGGHVATSYLADDANSAVPTAGVLTVTGAHGLNTTAPGSASTISTQINNAITLGDLAVLTGITPALTCTTGGITLSGSTGSLDSSPLIVFGAGNNRISFVHNDVYLGFNAGNLSGTKSGIFNIGIGPYACNSLTSGQRNIGIGNGALQNCVDGIANTTLGYVAGKTISSGSSNIFIGHEAGSGITTGSYNISIQSPAAADLTTGDSNNIHIGTTGGHGGENSTIRIGTHGAGVGQQNLCYIAGIRGITTTVVDAVPVLISSTHQLGTVSSSIRYKENVQDMGDETQALYKLRPVTFNFKSDASKSRQYGLIAEEAIQHLERLIVYNKDHEPETVKYMDLIPMTLNELIKHQAKIEHQGEVIKNLKDRLRILEEQIALLLNTLSKE